MTTEACKPTSPHLSGFVFYGCLESLTELSALCNTLRPRQNGRHFADYTFKCIFLNKDVCISIKILLPYLPTGPISNILALGQIIAWRRPGDKQLSELMMVSLLTHICITQPQWVKNAVSGMDQNLNWKSWVIFSNPNLIPRVTTHDAAWSWIIRTVCKSFVNKNSMGEHVGIQMGWRWRFTLKMRESTIY